MSSAALLTLALRDEGLSKAALVEVAGIKPVRTVWTSRNPFAPRGNRRHPLDRFGTRCVPALTPSTEPAGQSTRSITGNLGVVITADVPGVELTGFRGHHCSASQSSVIPRMRRSDHST